MMTKHAFCLRDAMRRWRCTTSASGLGLSRVHVVMAARSAARAPTGDQDSKDPSELSLASNLDTISLEPDVGRPPNDVVLGRYTIERVLGQGSSGVTYMARDRDSGRAVAIKEVSLARLKDWKKFDLFEREARTLKSLSHPNIPNYIDYQEDDGSYFLVQELAEGPTLAEYMRNGARLGEDEVERIAKSLLEVLKYLSSRRPPVIHRDLKPENIVLEGGRPGGRVLLVDFGGVQDVIANAASDRSFGTTIVGTSGYMPPEQFNGAATVASDLYSLGCVLLFLLSGRTPGQFGSERLRVQWERDVSVGPKLQRVLHGLLQPFAEDRMRATEALDVLSGKAPADEEVAGWSQLTHEATLVSRSGPPNGSLARTGYGRICRRWRDAPTSKPQGSRVSAEVTDGLLYVDIPPAGLTGDTAMTGAFALAWNGFIAFWTAAELASGGLLFALFALPFWFVGRNLVRDAAVAALTHDILTLDAAKWTFTRKLARLSDGVASFVGARVVAVDGDAAALHGAKVANTAIVNGVPQTAVQLHAGVEHYTLGEGLSISEQEYLVGQINRHLAACGCHIRVENDEFPSYTAEIINDRSRRSRFDRDTFDD